VLFSTGGAAIKATALQGWQVASFRSGVAAVALLLLLPAARRRPRPAELLVAVSYAATLVLFVLSTKWTTAASAIFLQSTAPLYVVLLSPRMLGERVRARDVVFLTVLAAGLSLFFLAGQAPQATAPRPVAGNVLGALTGLTWAFTVIGLRALGREGAGGGEAAVVAGNTLACLATLPMALSLPLTAAGPRDALLILYLGAVQIGVAYACLTTGLKRVTALTATLLLVLEPVLNPVWAYLVHGERVGPGAAAAGALILGATIAKNVLDLRNVDEVSSVR
jgi:drug/metabolite transporter (DMT)-like permease